MTPLIRLATADDAASIAEIYAPYVRDTPVSFEIEPPTQEKMQALIESTLRQLPWLVLEKSGQVAGYVYASPHRARAAYGWSVDVAVYIHPNHHRTGAGHALYTSLFEILKLQMYYNAYAGITLPNPGSIGLHTFMGFKLIGTYPEVGFKTGAWHDVAWLGLSLQPKSSHPSPPLPLAEVQKHPYWSAALNAGLPFLK